MSSKEEILARIRQNTGTRYEAGHCSYETVGLSR